MITISQHLFNFCHFRFRLNSAMHEFSSLLSDSRHRQLPLFVFNLNLPTIFHLTNSPIHPYAYHSFAHNYMIAGFL